MAAVVDVAVSGTASDRATGVGATHSLVREPEESDMMRQLVTVENAKIGEAE
jgi:hypothetical protein